MQSATVVFEQSITNSPIVVTQYNIVLSRHNKVISIINSLLFKRLSDIKLYCNPDLHPDSTSKKFNVFIQACHLR